MAFLSFFNFRDFIVVDADKQRDARDLRERETEGILFFRAVRRDHNNFYNFSFCFLG